MQGQHEQNNNSKPSATRKLIRARANRSLETQEIFFAGVRYCNRSCGTLLCFRSLELLYRAHYKTKFPLETTFRPCEQGLVFPYTGGIVCISCDSSNVQKRSTCPLWVEESFNSRQRLIHRKYALSICYINAAVGSNGFARDLGVTLR